MGDCPDAAYFGPHIREDSDDIEMLQLKTDDELHIVTLLNHRELGAAKYSSIALLTPGGWYGIFYVVVRYIDDVSIT